MALLTSASNNGQLIEDATTIQSFEGIIELSFDGGNRTYIVKSDRLLKRQFTIPAQQDAENGNPSFDGFRLLGSTTAISLPTAQGFSRVTIGGYFDDLFRGESVIIDNGDGKVDFGVSANDQQVNIKDISGIVSIVVAAAPADGSRIFIPEQGSIIFGRAGGDPEDLVTEGTAVTNNRIRAGIGSAIVTNTAVTPNVTYTINLDDQTYPFDVRTAENVSISPVGSSILLTEDLP